MPRCPVPPPFEFTTSGQCASRGSWRRRAAQGKCNNDDNCGIARQQRGYRTRARIGDDLVSFTGSTERQRHDGEEHGS